MRWPVVPLDALKAPEPRAITDGPFGSNLARRHYTEAGPRVIRLQNIGDGQFVDHPAHISHEHFESLRAHEVRSGDLLIASLGEVLPRACLAPGWLGPAIVKADCIRVRLGDGVDPRWVVYALQRPEARRWADEHRHGVGRPRLGLKVIREIPIPLPPLDEQRRIVDLLEDHLSRLDAAIKIVESQRKRLGAFESLDAHSLTTGWGRPQSLSTVSEFITDGDHNPPKRVSSGVPHVTARGIRPDGSIDLATGTFVSAEGFEQTARRYRPAAGDVIVTCVGTIGRIAVIPSGMVFSADRNLAAIRVDTSKVTPEYVALALRGAAVQQKLAVASGSTAQPHLYLRDLRAIEIDIPDLVHQLEVVRKAESHVGASRLLLGKLDRALLRGARLRSSLLEAAFSGRLTAADSTRARLVSL